MNIYGSNGKNDTLCARLIVIGDCGVGKTTMIRNFTRDNNFKSMKNSNFNMTDIFEGTWDLPENRRIKLTILDTGGMERYRSLTSSHYRGIHGCLIVFSVDQSSSFDSVMTWVKDLRQYTADNKRISTILIGTVCDTTSRDISYVKAESLAQHLGMPYMEINLNHESAKFVFEKLIYLITEQFQTRTAILTSAKIQVSKPKDKYSYCAC